MLAELYEEAGYLRCIWTACSICRLHLIDPTAIASPPSTDTKRPLSEARSRSDLWVSQCDQASRIEYNSWTIMSAVLEPDQQKSKPDRIRRRRANRIAFVAEAPAW